MMITPDGKALNFNFAMTRTTMKRSGFPVAMEVLKDGRSVFAEGTNRTLSCFLCTFLCNLR